MIAMNPRQRGPIPDREWNTPATVAALRERDARALLGLARKYGASQHFLSARAMYLTNQSLPQNHISLIASGKIQVEKLQVWERIAAALDMPDRARILLGLAPLAPDEPTEPKANGRSPGASTNADGRLAAADQLEALVQQREETAHLADAEQAGRSLSTDPHGGAPALTPADDEVFELAEALGHSNIAPNVLDLLEASIIRVVQTYSTVPPLSLLEWGRTRLAAVVALLRGSQPVIQRRRLCCVAGQIAGLRGWLAHDLHEPVAATSFYRVAATAAHEAGDEALHAWVLGNHSRIPIYEGKPRVALQLIQEALERAEGHASVITKAWLLAQASRAHSALRDHDAGGKALARAERLLDAADTADTSDEMVYFDSGRLAAFVGHHYLLAGRPAPAEEQIRTSLNQLKPAQVKHLALTRLDLASVLLAQNELVEACDQAIAALTIPAEQMIDSTVRRAGELRAQMVAHSRQFAPAHDVVRLIDQL